ncbi:ATP-binding cassette domain-containing protein [Spirosoma sp. HMF4905]|uniref:ATP-binding cassette domain-containing protein n=1 Tax=Spirosoma arboris TaxID=2682092 RepID=A0A7K1S8X6_9BACT|nr:ABC transporter ATP-binding protein [Spirosoma arboris]MVM30066.1 ATP-binding cassette domain-containing protein [Spirosoma arboris]
MQILWKYLKPYRWLAVLALVLAGIAQILALVDPIIFGKLIDQYATHPGAKTEIEKVRGVLHLLAIAVGVAVLSNITKAFQEYVTRLVVQKFGTDIFNDGLKQTLRLSYQEFGDQSSGATLSILQKVRTDTEKFINSFVNVLFSSIVGMGFLIWYAITKHWALVPVFVIGVLLLGGLTGLLSKQIKTTQRSINRETALLSGVITESLRNIELIKSLGLTFPEIRRLKTQTGRIFELEMFKVRRVRLLSFWQSTTLNILKQSVLFTLLWLIFRNVLSTGELISMQFISVSIFNPLQELGNIILAYREAEAGLNSFEKLMQKPIERNPESPIEVGPIERLRFSNVVFRHIGANQNAIDGVSFEASLGDTIAFVGPSGSGKSTMVKLLVGLYRPVDGEIYYNDISTKDIRFNPMRRQIGFVTQDTHLFAGTIRENLLFVKPDATEAEMLDALDKAACDHLLARSEQGLDTQIGEGGLKMSGGEKQRLSIARALVRHPRLLIFDEATSALDSLTEEEITDTVRSVSAMNSQITILIAHRLSTILHANTIFVLEKGKIVETGNHEALVAQKGLYYAMWRQQIGERRTSAVPV